MDTIPKGDVWEWIETDEKSAHYGETISFDFSPIESLSIKNVVKSFTWYHLKRDELEIGSIIAYVERIRSFSHFAASNGIDSLRELTSADAQYFKSYLATYVSESTLKPLKHNTQKGNYQSLKGIIAWAKRHLPNEVPSQKIFSGKEYKGTNKKLRIDYIPDHVVKQINKALLQEADIYIRCGIVILQETGMRIRDLQKLRVDCIEKHPISGGDIIVFYSHHNKKTMRMPVQPRLVNAVNELVDYTSTFRQEAEESCKDVLMIGRARSANQFRSKAKIQVYSLSSYRAMLSAFIQKHNIVDSNGDAFKLKSHQFRRTTATDMASKGVDMPIISQFLGIDIRNAPLYYADIKDLERAKEFQRVGIIGDINDVDEKLIPDEQELKSFKENKDKGLRMADGYCTLSIAKGVCKKIGNQLKCLRCQRFITTLEFLDVLKGYQSDLEDQLKTNLYGEHWESHLRPAVQVLGEIIERLEAIKNGN